MIKSLVVPARSATHVGYPAKRDHLLGQVSDLLGDHLRLLVIDQRLVVALRALINGADVIEHVGFIWEIADVTVYGESPPVSGEPVLITALVIVDASYIMIENRLVLRSAYLTEYSQRLLVAFECVPMIAEVQLHPAKIVEGLRLASPVLGVTVERKRVTQVSHCVGVMS